MTKESVETMGQIVSGQQLKYLLQVPTGTKPKDGWPVMLFLHGYGECGTDINKVRKHGPPKLTTKFDELAGCIIVSPQCPSDNWWRVEALKALMDEVVSRRSDIHRSRLYVTGLSMGGYGIWSFLSRYPDYFAAAIPICGGGDPFRRPANRPGSKKGIKNEFDPDGLSKATRIPIWTFHGAKDGSVPIAETEMLVELLRTAGNHTVTITAYEDAGHVGAWEQAYDDPSTWKWMFDKRKAAADSTAK